MKLVHLGDLHLGKRVNGFSMLEDQEFILKSILEVIDDEKPDGVLVAGDVYDRSIPSEEAVNMLDEFLVSLSRRNLQVILISGNHDSADRLAFGRKFFSQSGIHISPVYEGQIAPVTLCDEYGELDVWPIPFVKPVHVRRFYPEAEVGNYTDAMRVIVEHLPIDSGRRNVCIAHQFIVGASVCASEELSVGGTDQVSADVFAPFDYVALGHLHGPQKISKDTIRYAGSPLKYSFSEWNQKKGVTVVEIEASGSEPVITMIPLKPLRDMKKLKGSFEEVRQSGLSMEEFLRQDYYEITLTDEQDIPNGLSRLREVFPNIMTMGYDNVRTRARAGALTGENVEKKSEMELFEELYERQNGTGLNEEQRAYLGALIEEIWG